MEPTLSRSNPARRTSPRFPTVLFAALVALGVVVIALRASSALADAYGPSVDGPLMVRSIPAAPQWTDMVPGDEASWLIEASVEEVDQSSLAVQMHATGSHIEALTVRLVTCTVPFRHRAASDRYECPGGAQAVIGPTLLAAYAGDRGDDIYELAVLRRGQPRHLLVTLEIPSTVDPRAAEMLVGRIGVGVHAAGDPPDAPSGLAATGADLWADLSALSMLAAGGIGLGLRLAARGRSQPSGSAPS
ncbi:hypothetical protein [Microbacterium sp. 179-I 3D3 NHS]|uniref:hypothetical protein n=1 Tax=Microbacterium sp. 179-I 3D3 NHS TaxID=3142382 RepID=UPI0039A0DB2F